VYLVERVAGVGAAEADASALDGENGVVEVALWSREFARNGKGACDVCNIGTVLLCSGSEFRAKELMQMAEQDAANVAYPTGIDQDEVAFAAGCQQGPRSRGPPDCLP
jgi:hypothetical protein